MQQGGGAPELGEREPPEAEAKYPEPGMFGTMPSYGFFFRHVAGLEVSHAKVGYSSPEARPAIVLEDARGAYFDHMTLERGTNGAPRFDLRGVTDFSVTESRGITDTRRDATVVREKF
jgi:hypothetical protein